MSQENVEAVRAYFAAFDRGDLKAAADCLAEDVEWDWDEGMLIDEQTILGRENVKDYWERILASSPFHHEDHELYDVDDRVCLLANLRMRGAASGIEMTQACGYALTLRSGLVTRSVFYSDQLRARRAAGLAG
jgi:ketosteroid isomerase-like protein